MGKMSDPLSITASIIAVLQLTATATEYLRGIKHGDADRVKLRDELRSTTCLLEMLRDRIEDAEDAVTPSETGRPMSIKSLAGPDSPLVHFQRILEDIIAQLSPQNRLAKRQLAQSSYRVTQSSHDRIVDLGNKVYETRLKHQEDETQKIILWLSSLSFREQHVAILESVQPGTGGWFTKHETFRAWLEGKISMLWCPGLPGAGKTRLMSIVIDILEHDETSNNCLYTYIYCSYNRRNEQTSAALLSSLVQQVLQHSASQTVPLDVLALYNSHKKYGTRPTSKELTDLLGKLTSKYESLFVVIDALDECAESEEEALWFLLAKLHLESLSTKINRKAVRSALRTLTATLDDTYSEALQRIYDQPSDTVELAETVLLWVACARQSLTVMHLQHMYATQELTGDTALEDDDLPDADILTGACSGLITVDRESQAIHAIHYTVHQYFERSHGQKLMAARLSLTKVSLTYLALPNFSSGFCTSDVAMLQRLTEFPFLEYAAKHWGSEMNVVEVDEVLPNLERLFSNPMVIEMISQACSLPSCRYPNWSQEFPRKCPGFVLTAAFDLPTALIWAATFGHSDNVRVLLELGAGVNAQDYVGETALQRAARNGHASVIRVLLEGGACVNNKASNNWTPLMSAVSSGNLDPVHIIVEAGAELMVETEWGDSALNMAARSGQEAIATFLADHGALLPRGVAVAGRPLQRQSSRIMSGLPEILEIPRERPSDSKTEAQEGDEVSFAELMEQYDIKTGFYQRYNLMQQIGKGHFATVYCCSNRVTGVVFAVKIFQRQRAPTSSDFETLHYEIQLLREPQKHSHPNLMRMADLFADFEKKRICLVIDLGREGDLFDVVVAKKKFTEAETRLLFTQLLSAIKFLHDCGWVHRDVKPENILVMDKNLTIQLSDFGLAKKLHTESGIERLTRTLCGTPSYVAAEVIQNRRRRYRFPVDLWSSGVVLYICLCGFPPFSDELYTEDNPYTQAQQIQMGQYYYPSPYWDDVGDPALDLIDRMLTCLVFELLGPSVNKVLADYYESEDNLETEDIFRMTEQLLEAIQFIHDAGMGHGVEEDLFEVLRLPETKELVHLDGKPLDKGLPKHIVKAAKWDEWVDEDEEDLRILDLGEGFLQGHEPKALFQPGQLKIYAFIFKTYPFYYLGDDDVLVADMIGFVEELPEVWQPTWNRMRLNSKRQLKPRESE
ncbi:hypothetical protein CDV55_103316 [Aspergillus turcosus]|uniref:Protein kinase domain-containing protein n=1 Tax=Aspergillus turcosus TaxID=1245748 RepID=A0A397I0W1_9EURO|nr:hypothetical protein CDV55_103316 [Aspergillus turcosus]RLM00389.1 hypothetical protein CFD26_107649 [Aspergillus turcosus]